MNDELYQIYIEAKSKILPAGYKPEDYLIVSKDFPIKIAKMIVDEMRHIIKMKRVFYASRY